MEKRQKMERSRRKKKRMMFDGGSGSFTSCAFIGNTASIGAALYITRGSEQKSVVIIDTLFQNNQAVNAGGKTIKIAANIGSSLILIAPIFPCHSHHMVHHFFHHPKNIYLQYN